MNPGPVSEGTLGTLLRRMSCDRPDAEALVVPAFAHGGVELRLTARQLDRTVDDMARGLLALGIGTGEHVAVWAANVPDWVPLQFALARVGAVMVTVNTALTSDELAYVLGQSGATAVFHTSGTGTNRASATLDALFEQNHASVARLRTRVWMPSGPSERAPDGCGPHGHGPLEDMEGMVARGREVSLEQVDRREAACRPDDVVHIQYTSGTTGFPKGVLLSSRNILCSGRALGEQMRTGPSDRVGLMVPLFHCFGCVVCVLGAYTHGAALCTLGAFDPADVLHLVEAERITILNGVPTMFSALLDHPDRARRDLSSLRCGIVAGAPCPEPLMRAIVQDLPCPGASVAYGLTEASPGVAGSRPDDSLTVRCTTVGRELPGVEIRLVDPATGADGPRGELWLRGPNVMLGYHDDAAATATVLDTEGWLRTGDLATRDEAGHLRIVGRIKDIIIRGGENIAPAAIESVLREHPDILEAAVLGIPDKQLGEQVAAALVLRPGTRLDPPSYERLLAERVARFKIPAVWRAFDAFPLTGSGKVRKHVLREKILSQHPARD